jgi:hypothetical protein
MDTQALLEQLLARPKQAAVDGQSVTNYSPSEIRELLNLLREEEARASGSTGMQTQKMEYTR